MSQVIKLTEEEYKKVWMSCPDSFLTSFYCENGKQIQEFTFPNNCYGRVKYNQVIEGLKK